MDVQCERCKTEYEFDDALVSGRGTTVKCTNCGFQFKIRPHGDALAHERWTIRTTDGRELVFTTLRELQRAITQRQVGRADSLSRGTGPSRPLATISELEPFFRNSDRPPPFPVPASMTGGAATFASPGPGPRTTARGISAYAQTTTSPSQGGAMSHTSATDQAPPQRERLATLRPPAAAPPPPQAQAAQLRPLAFSVPPPSPRMPFPLPIESAGLREPEEQAGTTSLSNDDPTREYGALGGTLETPQPLFPLQASTTEIAAMGGTLPPPTMPVRRGNPSFAEFDTNDPFDGAPPYSMAPQRRRVGGWIVAVILLLGVGLIGYRIGMPYLTSGEKGNAAVAALDPRAVRFLTDGEHAMEDGNLDLARENFDKASALGERDPRVLLDLAKLATVRGDIPWLKLRLLPESAEDDVKETKQELLGLVPGMRKAADEAAARAPEDTAAVRVRIDAMRIGGDVDLARSLVSKAGTSSQAETSYVLATLDVAEMSPPWNTVIDRLRIAAAAEGNLGRARAMLVYALARAGDTAAAKAQLDRLAALSRLHPLVGSLRAFLARGSTKGEAEAHGAPVVGSASAAAHGNTQPRPPGGQEPPDPRFLVQQAAEAENRGQLGRAAKLYEDAVRIDGRNSEAHAGLGSVSLKQGDPATARQHFDRALAINPNYVPALVGQADALWQEGDKNGAMAKYKDLVDRFPESSGYPAYVKTRVAGSSSGAASSAAPAGGASPVTPETTPSANPKPSEGSPGAKPNELTLPSNVPSDLPGTP